MISPLNLFEEYKALIKEVKELNEELEELHEEVLRLRAALEERNLFQEIHDGLVAYRDLEDK